MSSTIRDARRFGSNRPLVASYHSKAGKKTLWKRYFVRIETALRRAVELLALNGNPGDVIDIASNDFGFPIATVKVHAQGRITLNYSLLNTQRKAA